MSRPGALTRLKQAADTSSAFVRNMVQRRTQKHRFLLQDMSAYDVILRDGLMSVRHYKPLTESEVLIEGQVQPVSRERYRIPLVLVPPLA